MMSMWNEQPLPALAIEYIRQQLLDGNALAKAVLNAVTLEEGQVTTCLPQGVAPKSLEDYRTGGKLPTPPTSEWKATERDDETLLMIPVPTSDDWLVSRIGEYLSGGTNRVGIFEDALKRAGDPILRTFRTRYGILDREVYHLLLGGGLGSDHIRRTINHAKAIPTFIGVLSEWDGEYPNDNPVKLSGTCIHSLAARAKKLLVGAFDGESYLIWEKGKPARPRV